MELALIVSRLFSGRPLRRGDVRVCLVLVVGLLNGSSTWRRRLPSKLGVLTIGYGLFRFREARNGCHFRGRSIYNVGSSQFIGFVIRNNNHMYYDLDHVCNT